jgi:hypothetical protein
VPMCTKSLSSACRLLWSGKSYLTLHVNASVATCNPLPSYGCLRAKPTSHAVAFTKKMETRTMWLNSPDKGGHGWQWHPWRRRGQDLTGDGDDVVGRGIADDGEDMNLGLGHRCGSLGFWVQCGCPPTVELRVLGV